MRHVKGTRFKALYDALPPAIRALADKNFALLKQDPKHPSLHFKRVQGNLWSARVGKHYRALALEGSDRFQWFWIGPHAEYDRIISM
jgi:hypothetical protein